MNKFSRYKGQAVTIGKYYIIAAKSCMIHTLGMNGRMERWNTGFFYHGGTEDTEKAQRRRMEEWNWNSGKTNFEKSLELFALCALHSANLKYGMLEG